MYSTFQTCRITIYALGPVLYMLATFTLNVRLQRMSGSDSRNMIGQLRVFKCGIETLPEGGGYSKCQKAGILP